MRTTKVVATVGPSSSTSQVLRQFLEQGVDLIRFNMSHGEFASHEAILANLGNAAEGLGVHVGRMADLCGPKVRTGAIDSGSTEIAAGATCTIARDEPAGTAERFETNYADLIDDVDVGHRVLIDDGQVRLRVTEKSPDALVCVCEIGGVIESRKGINLPDSRLSLASMTEKDHADLRWAVRNGFDFVALSFVRSVEDVSLLRDATKRIGADIPIISKIETPQAIDAIDGIIEISDGVLVARGDLGVEMDVSRLPMLQKEIVHKCRVAGRPVIVATQMFHSMVHHATPTRAEVSDVANAVFEGADAVMLSAESAVGQYPVEAVAVMNRVCHEASEYRPDRGSRRSDVFNERLRVGNDTDRIRSAVARSATLVAQDLAAALVAVWCRSARTAQWMSKYRMPTPLVGLSADAAVCRRLTLAYGIQPMQVPASFADGSAPWRELEARLVDTFSLERGDLIVVVGDPEAPERASTMSIRAIGA